MVPCFSSRQLSKENDMWLLPGKGPFQQLGDGNRIFNKWPGKLLIIVPFLGLQFQCPESLSNHLRLLVLSEGKNVEIVSVVKCCLVLTNFTAFILLPLDFVGSLLVFNLNWDTWSNARKWHQFVAKVAFKKFFFCFYYQLSESDWTS